MKMNQYGKHAQRYLQEYMPERYAEIESPTAFFANLGEEMAQRVDELSMAIAGADPPVESYLEKVRRLNQARMAAEEEVMREMLPSSEHEDESHEGQPAT